MVAAEHGHKEVVMLLINARANIDLQDKVRTFELKHILKIRKSNPSNR